MEEATTRNTVRWRRIALGVAPMAIVVVVAAALQGFVLWIPLFPRDLGNTLTEGFLRALLFGYAAVLVVVPASVVLLAVMVARARKRRGRLPERRTKLLLLGLSVLLALGLAELSAATWLAWKHRMPTLPVRFPEPSNPDEVSLVVLGGSSAMGYPYERNLSVGQIVAWQLERAVPGTRFVADVRANLGKNLEQMHQELARSRRKPDAVIVYSGHNEIQSRYETSRDAGSTEDVMVSAFGRLYWASWRSPLCRLIYETISENRLGGPPPPVNRHRLIDRPAYTRAEYDTILREFRHRLEAIVSYCERIGALPILVIPPGNDAGFEPNRTVLPASVSEAERQALTEAFQVARDAERDDPERSMALYRDLIARQPRFAEAHFRLGRLLERSERWEEAGRQYALARDLDGFALRCPSDFQDAYREVAARHGCILVDGLEVLRRASPHGLLDDHVFHDGHHPNLIGHAALAQAILDALHERRAFGWRSDSPPAVDPVACAEHFEMDREAWVGVCARSATFYRDFTPSRYDPTERQLKHRLYEEAQRRIAAGVPPDLAEIPGLDLRPTDPVQAAPSPTARAEGHDRAD